MYYDDRLFVLYVCLGTVEIEDELVTTTIYHENPPFDAKWCLVTYRNCENYPAFSVVHFQDSADAITYMRLIEPTTPLVSSQGQTVTPPVSYDAYSQWKIDEHLEEYDYRKCYRPGGANAIEMIMQTKEQFLASERQMRERLGRGSA